MKIRVLLLTVGLMVSFGCRIAYAQSPMGFSCGSKGVGHSSSATHLCLQNKTASTILLQVRDVDNYDWDGSSRPDHNFHNVSLAPDQMKCQRLEINCRAINHAFTLVVSDVPTKMMYITLAGSGVKGWAAEFKPQSTTATSDLYGAFVKLSLEIGPGSKDGAQVLRWQGLPCPYDDCALYTIGKRGP